ncbi:MAG: hypothetical protein ACRDR6_14515, partial [Pseudonocardiaceae bacterium]
MSGGLASWAARRTAAPEPVSRSRPESATRAPVRQPVAALGGRRSQVPSTRERMQASFVAGPRADSREAIRAVGLVEAAPVAPATAASPAAEALTTRDRIVNRALAVPVAAPSADAPASSVAVAPAEMRDRRRPQRSDAVLRPARPSALAPVIALVPRSQIAMPGVRGIAGRGDVVARSAPARAGPEAVPAGITATASPTRKLDPESSGAPARAGPDAVPKAGAASGSGASAEVCATARSWTLDTIFTGAENAARKGFEEYVDQKTRACKADRGVGGAYWLTGKALDFPGEVNDFYRDGHADQLVAMDGVIDAIAAVVGLLLGTARLRIQAGRGDVRTFVIGLPVPVRELGEEMAGELDNQFDQLSSGIDVKRGELDTRITELQELSKGFVSKAIDAVLDVKTTYELGELLPVLLTAACAVGDIVAHPIRFLGNLVDPAKGGLDHLVSRIDVHLQEALLDLLFGQLGSLSITLPNQWTQEPRPDDSPGASAPGIGDVRRHGQQSSSVRSGPRVWWTEPEHVMPYAVGEMLWDTVSDLIPGRGGVEDDQQTTIMIYEPAARQKASGHDGPMIASFTSQYIANLQPMVRRLRRFRDAEGRVGVDSPARRDFTGVYGHVLARMAQMSSSAVAATQAAVRDEHADADASGQTNGARRAEPAPLPTNAQIATAAEEQYDDVID